MVNCVEARKDKTSVIVATAYELCTHIKANVCAYVCFDQCERLVENDQNVRAIIESLTFVTPSHVLPVNRVSERTRHRRWHHISEPADRLKCCRGQ